MQSNCVHSVRRQLFTAAKGASDGSKGTILLSFKCLIPTASADKPTEADEQNLRQLYKMYADVLHGSELSAVGDLRLWYSRVRDTAPKNAREALVACNQTTFPVIHSLLRILATLPVTTSSSERSFSTLR